MATVKPFPALLPKADLASRICELPYDVMSTEEAREMAEGNPLSFLHVSRPEIDLPEGTDPYSEEVYAKGRENLDKLRGEGALIMDDAPRYYFYRQIMGDHAQTGLVALADCQEYLDGIVKKHEFTRPAKEDDRVRHIESLDAQTGPVFLTYPATDELNRITAEVTSGTPDVDFTAKDGVRHTSWSVQDDSMLKAIQAAFEAIPALYIADGHHRSAAAGRVFQSRQGGGTSGGFLSVIFPHDQMCILAYNRAVKDLNGHTPADFLEALGQVATLGPATDPVPDSVHACTLYLEGKWHRLDFHPSTYQIEDPAEALDVSVLQRHVLKPLLGIDDPRTSDRIAFVGGIRGTRELEKLVDSGEFACAFSMHPTRITDLMDIADGGGIMPPKSTWFEPKLRDAMFSHVIA